jgi:hypothetical protein
MAPTIFTEYCLCCREIVKWWRRSLVHDQLHDHFTIFLVSKIPLLTRTSSMNGRSLSEDFTLYAEEPMSRALQLTTRSLSFCDSNSYHLPLDVISDDHNTSYDIYDDVIVEPYMDYPQATTMAEKCGYRTGKCFNVRSLKRNGMFHKLCDAHREKANLNQKRLDQKRRLRRISTYNSPRCDKSHNSNSDNSSRNKKLPVIMNLNEMPDVFPTCIDETPPVLTVDELEIFCNIMKTENLKKNNQLLCQPIQWHCRSEIDISVDLDMLFMLDAVDQMYE